MKAVAKGIRGAVGVILLAVFVWLAARFLDGQDLWEGFASLLVSPHILILITVSYALSFILKASAWRIYAEAAQPLRKHVAPLGYSLLVNHLLPIKAGDLVRTGLAARLEDKPWHETLHTVAILRIMDISVLLLFSACGIAVWGIPWEADHLCRLTVIAIAIFLLLAAMLLIARRRFAAFTGRQHALLKRLSTRKAAAAWLLTAASWVLEAAVPLGVLFTLQIPLTTIEAVWVNSMTVAGQVFHITPGGIGTYETTMSASLAALGVSAAPALTAAVVSHGYKFMFSFAAGIVSWMILPVRIEEGIRWLSRRRIGKVEPAE